MANPRQRRKSRSSSYTGATKSAKRAQNKRVHRAPTVMGPSVLRENWDKTLTTRQNYAKLGLAPSLAPASGGLDRKDPYRHARPAEAPAEKPRKGMARIVRDEQGAVVDVVEGHEDGVETTPWGPVLNADEQAPADLSMFPPKIHEQDGDAVQKLADIAKEAKPVERFVSDAEGAWLAELVHAHGDDYEAMARDRHRNIQQRTPGEIRRAIDVGGGTTPPPATATATMGNALSGTSHRVGGAGELVFDSQLQYECSLGASRFLRTTRVRHPLGLLVVKTFGKPDTSLRLRRLVRRLRLECEALEDVPNVLTYQTVIETEEAGYLVRQWLLYSLYDRISTRPFLSVSEKLWISYQLLYAMHASSERNVAHGDLKCENVLVTSSLTVYITDFASSFKPTYLPLDDPADFSLFFDTTGRRTCYVAPERFYDARHERHARRDAPHAAPASTRAGTGDVENVSELLTHEPYLETLGLGRPNGRVTEKMDVFSLGCVLAELWRDGSPLFTLSQLFRYRNGQYDVQGLLDEISHEGIRNVIAPMLHVDPAARPTFGALLADTSTHVFPRAYSAFLHTYLVALQRPLHGARAPDAPDAATRQRRWARAWEPDERMERLYEDWPTLLQHIGPGGAVLDGAMCTLDVCLPHMRAGAWPRRQRLAEDGPALLVLSMVLANVRSCRRVSSRCHAMEMMMHLAYGWLTDEACLDRVLPYYVHLLSDPHAVCRALALRYLIATLSLVERTTPGNTGLVGEYVVPHVRELAHDPNVYVRAALAAHLARLVQCATHLVQLEQTQPYEGSMGCDYDEQMEHLRLFVQEHALLLLTDPEAQVRRALLRDMAPIGTLLGTERIEATVLGHLLTLLNDPDWELRAAFFPAMEALVPVLSDAALERCVHPILVQALGDEEETVVVDALRSFRRLLPLPKLGTATRYELLRHASGLLCHPNVWIREAALGLVAEAARGPPAMAWTQLYALVRPRLRCDVGALTAPVLYAHLTAPLPRAVLTAAIAAVAKHHTTFLHFWEPRATAQWDAGTDAHAEIRRSLDRIVRPTSMPLPVDAWVPSTPDEKAMLARLAALGMDAVHDAPKLVGLWWYIVRCARRPRRTTDVPDASLQHVPQHTIFFTPRASPARAPIPDAALAMAKLRLQRVNAQAVLAPQTTDAPGLPEAPRPTPSAHARRRQPPVGTTHTKAAASTTVVHAHAECAQRQSKVHPADAALHWIQEGDKGPEANKVSDTTGATDVAGTPTAPSDASPSETPRATTYDGSDPYIHVHLDAVYDEVVQQRRTADSPHKQAGAGRGPGAEPSTSPAPWRTKPPSTHARHLPPPFSSNVRPEGTLIGCCTEHRGAITALAAASDHVFFVSGAEDGQVKVWDTARLEKNVTASARLTYTAHAAPITALCVLHDTHCIVSAARDGSLHAYGVGIGARTGASLPRYSAPQVLGRHTLPPNEYVACMGQLTSGRTPMLVLGTSSGRVLLWDVRTMQCVHTFAMPATFGGVQAIAVDPHAHWVCTGSTNGMLALWDVRFKLCLRAWAVGDAASHAPHRVQALAVHPSHARCVLVAYASEHAPLLDVFDLDTGRVAAVYATCDNELVAPGASRRHYRALAHETETSAAALATLLTQRTAATKKGDPPTPTPPSSAPVAALHAAVQGYTSSGTPRAGYVVCAGTEGILFYFDLGRVEKSMAWGLHARGEFVCAPRPALTAPPAYVHRRAPQQQAATHRRRTPLHATHAPRELHRYIQAHKDAITALTLLEYPFRCVVAGDRSGAIRVWE